MSAARGAALEALAERAAGVGVDILPGPTFSCQDALDGWLRVAFTAPADVLVSGLDRLAAAWNSSTGA